MDSDGDGLTDLADPGCEGPGDLSERTPLLPCDDGSDNDGDLLTNHPQDPGCVSVFGIEAPACQNGLDDDDDGTVDFDGGASIHGEPVAAADPHCQGFSDAREAAGARRCGLGFEVAPLLAGLAALRRSRLNPSA